MTRRNFKVFHNNNFYRSSVAWDPFIVFNDQKIFYILFAMAIRPSRWWSVGFPYLETFIQVFLGRKTFFKSSIAQNTFYIPSIARRPFKGLPRSEVVLQVFSSLRTACLENFSQVFHGQKISFWSSVSFPLAIGPLNVFYGHLQQDFWARRPLICPYRDRRLVLVNVRPLKDFLCPKDL